MRIFYLVKKEFKELFRQKELLPLIFIAPLIQVIILGYVVRTDIKNIPIKIENHSKTIVGSRLVNRIRTNGRFKVQTGLEDNGINNEELLKQGKVVAVIIMKDFKGSNYSKFPNIQVLMDGVDSNTSAIAAGYLNGIIKGFLLNEVRKKGVYPAVKSFTTIRFNPDLASINYMGPGIVGLLLVILALFLTSVSIVREKEQQTMDTLLISRLTAFEIYVGKAIPMAIIGMLQMFLGLVTVILWFRIPIAGNLIYLFLSALVFLPAILSYALFISTLARTQQQALFFSWFSMITFILMSGLFSPVANIPKQLRWIADINPVRYFIKIIREIFLKGNSIEYFFSDLIILSCITVLVFALSLLSFRKFIYK
jgi:ABC-2 type transport system permease protein